MILHFIFFILEYSHHDVLRAEARKRGRGTLHSQMIAAAEKDDSKAASRIQSRDSSLMIVLENPRAICAPTRSWMRLSLLRGASLGWHDYLASTARLFKEDGNYRISRQSGSEHRHQIHQSVHRLVADVVGSRGGIKVGGMYGILAARRERRISADHAQGLSATSSRNEARSHWILVALPILCVLDSRWSKVGDVDGGRSSPLQKLLRACWTKHTRKRAEIC